MSVPLGIGGGRKMIPDPVLLTKLLKRSAVKLCPVIRDQYLGNPKWVMMFFHTNFLELASIICVSGSTSTHLVK